MTKGSYAVGEDGSRPSRNDNSYRSFICALLIFLMICLIVLLASISWGSRRHDPVLKNKSDNENEDKSAQTGEKMTEDVDNDNKLKSNQTFEKIRVYETTTTKKEWINQFPETTTFGREIQPTTASNENDVNVHLQEETTTINIKDKDKNSLDQNPEITTETETGDIGATTEKKYYVQKVEVTNDNREEITTSRTDIEEESVKTEQSNLLQKIVTIITTTEDGIKTNKPKISKEDILITPTSEMTTSTTDIEEESVKTEQSNLLQNIETIITTTEDGITTNKTKISKEDILITPTSEEATSTTDSQILDNIYSTATTRRNEKIIFPVLTTEKKLSTTTTTSTSTTEITIMESESVTESNVSNTELHPPIINTSKPECSNAICKTVSSRILSMMNHSAEPCDDFYEFACGNAYEIEDSSHFQDMKILDDQLRTTKYEYIQTFKKFYESCVNHENYFNFRKRMAGLEELLKEVGEFQINNISTSIDFTNLVSSLVLRQSMPLFDIGVDIDKHSSNFILQLSLPHQSFLRADIKNWSGLLLLKRRCLQEQKSQLFGTHISLTDIYEMYKNCQGDYSSYLDSVEAVIRELTAFSSLDPQDLTREIKNIRFTIEFEVLNNLDTLPSSADILSTFINKNYEIRRVSDLQKHFPIIEWKRFFEILTNHQIQDNTLIQLYYAEYFKNVFTQLAKVDQRKLNNAFLAIYSYDLFVNTVVPKEKYNRNVFCVDLSKKLLPDIWSNFAFSSRSSAQLNSDNTKVSTLFEELKKIFCKSLLEAEWIDDDTKTAILKKCNSINLAVFKEPIDFNKLSEKYREINMTNNYQANLINSLANYKKMVYSTEGTPFSPKTIFSYFLDPLGTKSLASYSVPTIVVPMGLMRKTPTGLPDYLIKTRVGFTLGRQLARHFDPTGIKYQIQLTSTAKSSYLEFVHTMTTLMDYSSPRMFHDKNISFFLNGSLSLNERIVDNTAFRLIYDSLNFDKNEDILPWISVEYSREKIFFIAAAQELCRKTTMLDFMLQVFEQRHLPAVLRVENIIGNSQQFTSRFSCPDGSAMDLPEKVQFPYIPEEEYEDDLQDS